MDDYNCKGICSPIEELEFRVWGNHCVWEEGGPPKGKSQVGSPKFSVCQKSPKDAWCCVLTVAKWVSPSLQPDFTQVLKGNFLKGNKN